MENAIQDERFSHIAKDPRFRSVPKNEKKIVVDKRFQSMFHDKRFKLQYAMDKRGRKLVHSTAEDLKKFYDIESEEDDENEEAESDVIKEPGKQAKRPNRQKQEADKVETKSNCSEDDRSEKSDIDGDSEKEIDLARGQGNVETSSSDDDGNSESDEDEVSDTELDHKWGELDAEAPRTDDVTRRLAICNMDWDRIKADDLFVLVNSMKPLEGIIASVKIYQSDYGRERMKIEEMKGPVELVEKLPNVGNKSQNPEGNKFHMERLRKYQLNRLKYYYAVVGCDSAETANKIYEELDGMEYESSATQLDLRFIPDDMVFDQEPTSATYKMPDANKYEANIFTTTALQQAKVDLTWDETDPDRIKMLQKAFKDSEDVDLKAYLASSSEEEEEAASEDESQLPIQKSNSKSQIEKYKELLASIEEEKRKESERDIDMEITWEPGLKEKTENLIKIKQMKESPATPWEEYLEKKKEKTKQRKKDRRENLKDTKEESSEVAFSDDEIPSDIDMNNPYFKEEFDSLNETNTKKKKLKNKQIKERTQEDEANEAELELLLMDEDDGKKHFNLKDLVEETQEFKKNKRKKRLLKRRQDQKGTQKEDDFQVDTADPRFSALYSSALFNIDPSDPHFKKTKGTEAIIREKQKKRSLPNDNHPTASKSLETDAEFPKKRLATSSLVKSVISKTERLKRKNTK